MNHPVQPADPGSCSRLGGALRSGAARIAASARPCSEEPGLGPLAEVVVTRLDAVGAALQTHAQELAELSIAAQRLADAVAAAGLALDGWRVVEPYGVASAPVAARRLAELPGLQGRADRLASATGRSRAALQRRLTEAAATLDAAVRPSWH